MTESLQMTRSKECYDQASRFLAGGVNSPVRAFGGVGGTPIFFEKGEGAQVWDVDGNRYIDFVCSWGPLILGHAHPSVVAALAETAARGTSFGAPSQLETQLAELVTELVPSLEMVRFVNSGTEATMSALRLARGYTGRSKFIKFSGCYHGHGDAFLAEAGSGVATLSIPGTQGVTEGMVTDTLTAPYNDISAVQAHFDAHPDDIAAVFIEPVAGNMGLVKPQPGFLEGLRALCDSFGALLIFDEVMTGFRVALGGAQARFDVRADLACFGKVIGGGLPVGAYGGRKDIMEHVAPKGGVYQAGTLSGNPLAMAAGLATLNEIRQPGVFQSFESAGNKLCSTLRIHMERHSVPGHVSQCGSMFGIWFGDSDFPPHDYASVKAGHIERFNRFFHACLRRGVYLAPSAYEVGFLSTAHTSEVLDEALAVFDQALLEVASH